MCFVRKLSKVWLATVVVMNLQAGLEAQLQQEEEQQRALRGGVSTRGASKRAATASSEQPLLCTRFMALPSQPLPHEEVTTSEPAQDEKPMFRTTAAATAAPGAAAASASRMQQWEGDSLVGRVTNAAHNSMLQPAAHFRLAHTGNMADDSTLRQGAGVQLGQVGGARLSRKRLAEENDVQPAAKRWQLDGSLTSGASKKNNLWGIASAARAFGGGIDGMEAAQAELGVAEGQMAWSFNSVLSRAAVGQQYICEEG